MAGVDHTVYVAALDRVLAIPPVAAPDWTATVGTVHPGDLVGVSATASPDETLPRVTVRRAADLLCIEFRFINLKRVAGGDRPLVVRKDRDHAAYLIAVFGPQHLLEQAFFESAGPIPTPKDLRPAARDTPELDVAHATSPTTVETPHYPVRARIAEPTRLSFHVTDERIEYSSRGLLHAMRVLSLAVARHASAPAQLLDWRQLVERIETSTTHSAVARLAAVRNVAVAGRAVLPGSPVPPAPVTVASGATASAVARAAALLDLQAVARTADTVAARFGSAAAVAAVGRDIPRRVDLERRLRARVRTTAAPVPPTAVQTALEIPWRLQLSPHSRGAFTHGLDTAEHDGRVELWHSRLGTREKDAVADLDPDASAQIDERDPASRTVRAVWTRDLRDAKDLTLGADVERDDPFRTSLSARDRVELVHLTSNPEIPGYHPTAAAVQNLMLTAAGGWLALDAAFDPPAGLSLTAWKHRATLGRDHDVKVVRDGVLLPFGHRASLVKVTERKVKADRFATLYQRYYIVVREHDRRFTGVAGLPFGWVRLLTSETPALALPAQLVGVPATVGALFVPAVLGAASADAPDALDPAAEPYRFRFAATDVTGRLVEFDGPMVFAEKTVLGAGGQPSAALAAANGAPAVHYPLRGQRVAFAPPHDLDDTRLATDDLRFDACAVHAGTSAALRAPNYVEPSLRVARAVVPAMAAFTGQTAAVTLGYPEVVKNDPAFIGSKNPRELFLQVVDTAGAAVVGGVMAFDRQTQASGAFLSPAIAVAGLARVTGPVGGDLNAFTTPGGFDVGAMFPTASAKLFGVLPLAGLLGGDGVLPAFATRALDVVADLRRRLTELTGLAGRLAAAPKAMADAAAGLRAHAEALLSALADALEGAPVTPDDFHRLLTTAAEAAQQLAGMLESAGEAAGMPRPEQDAVVGTLRWLGDLAGAAGGAVDEVVALVGQLLSGEILPERVSAELRWETRLAAWPNASDWLFRPAGLAPGAPAGIDVALRLVSRIDAPLRTGGVPVASVSCSLPPFAVRLFPGAAEFVNINVKTMEYSVQAGRKPEVDVRLGHPTDARKPGIEFVGALGFVERLRALIPDDGFSDPPYLDIRPSGLKAGYAQQIPDLAVGVFALTNIQLGAELTVPFIGEALEFRFFFATRENPFRLQVAFFAGGGFFAIAITPNGLKMIEAALEFGAAASMDFGVASGSICVVAGIYFRLEALDGGGQRVELTGYFRVRGMVDVLHLITASIELYLELRYESLPEGGKATGTASISVEVSVTFVSFSVTVSCTKRFAGSAGDPTFLETMGGGTPGTPTGQPWAEYCAAFAKESV